MDMGVRLFLPRGPVDYGIAGIRAVFGGESRVIRLVIGELGTIVRVFLWMSWNFGVLVA
jgi:hypothetical protein